MKKQILFETTILMLLTVTVLVMTISPVFAWTYYDWQPAHDTDGSTHGVTSYATGYYNTPGAYQEELSQSFRCTQYPWGFLSSLISQFDGYYSSSQAYSQGFITSGLNYHKYYYYSNIKTVATYTACDFINWDTYDVDPRSVWASVTASGGGTPI